MNITLFHNPAAGKEEPDELTLRRAFEREGHTLVYRSSKEEYFEPILKNSADVIAVAGGDGTVRKVLRHLVKCQESVPVLILPIGTANNIARGTGAFRPWEAAVKGLGEMSPEPFLHGFVKCDGVDEVFFESVGIGVFATLMNVAKKRPEKIDAISGGLKGFPRVHAALAAFCDKERVTPLEFVFPADAGITRSIWLEVLNIPGVGPLLDFGPAYDSRGSGFLKAACAAEEHRKSLSQWLMDKSEGKDGPVPSLIPFHFDGTTRISWRGNGFHIDDEVFHYAESRKLSLEIGRAPGKLRILR